ncbi:g6975 [Coccomyxa viridis]|uniref:G6975 protein n=1 Tax=Coccomyxa viridis TaxID=1274662 RepID=A0ABP1G1I4_9CHLO
MRIPIKHLFLRLQRSSGKISASSGTAAMTRARSPEVSKRVRATDDPVMVQARRLLGGAEGVVSLAQGAVHWGPPAEAIAEAASHATEPSYSAYGPDEGLPELRSALQEKIERDNGLTGYNVMVTAGANQALTSIMLTLLDPPDKAVLFRPYYFNALMALQMTGCGQTIAYGPSDPDNWFPDLDWLEDELESATPPKLVYIVNPCNPTGVTLPRETLDRLARITADAGTWLVIDETYEDFLFSGQTHYCPNAPNVVHVFSFSKGYGLMGWRCGYIAYPNHDNSEYLGLQLLKVQDTCPIHSAHMSQHVALGALQKGRPWLAGQLKGLEGNRAAVLEALKPLGTLGKGVYGGDAIYIWAKLPAGCTDDKAVVEWMVHTHKVSVIPGTGCGIPGHIRVAFGKPAPADFREAADRLHVAMQELSEKGFSVVKSWQQQKDR